MLEIRPRRVGHVIVRAREIEAKVGRWDRPGDPADAETILETRKGDATEAELIAFMESMNEDEQASLVALMWIGREDYEPEDLAEAMAAARASLRRPVAGYLLGQPQLADYLEEGLERLGISAMAAEEEVL